MFRKLSQTAFVVPKESFKEVFSQIITENMQNISQVFFVAPKLTRSSYWTATH